MCVFVPGETVQQVDRRYRRSSKTREIYIVEFEAAAGVAEEEAVEALGNRLWVNLEGERA